MRASKQLVVIMRKRELIVGAATALLAVGALVSCGGPTAPPRSDSTSEAVPSTSASTPAPDSSTAAPERSSSSGRPSTAVPTQKSAPEQPTGEIWEWALGRNVFEDPALYKLTSQLGHAPDYDTDINVQSRGYQLTMDSEGTVVQVTLYNDENELGYPGSETNFSAYSGRLPGGLTWQETASTMGAQANGENQVGGGWGIEYSFRYATQDGYRLEVTFAAAHSDELAEAPIHSIGVRRG